jgi:non-lysosomal glucosylceramidase
MPRVHSGFGTPYYRRYTRFYGVDPGAARELVRDALFHADIWEAQIQAWQNPVLLDGSLPEWYRMALFNELYYLVDGGTLWCYPANENPGEDEMGHFAYLESHEYRFYNTYDVHFYASFALIMNWPKVELALQRDLGEATLAEYPQRIQEMFQGKWVLRKVRGAVPHDVGLPGEDPWKLVNGYNLHDVNEWKDLNPKLVLQVYRDLVASGDDVFLADLWPAVEAAMERVAKFDRDGDGLIENDGFPDQTYDVWSVKGPSAYTGGLWLAALSAAVEMAERLGKTPQAARYRELLARGQVAYEQKLWNGRYFNYDSSRSQQHDSIMADQLAGEWYARACGLPPVVKREQAISALQTIFANNVQGFGGGQAGAVNGMRPNGQVDRSWMQSQEVWSGTTYGVAAAMLHLGLRKEAFQTAYGIYKITYEDKGYWFQTPEAWLENGDYRSNTYMRPLCIWAMQWALERPVS